MLPNAWGWWLKLIQHKVIPRDRHAMYFATLGVVASSIERLATEIRHMQRTEVREAEEFFSSGQKGSSAMPHKRNPVLTENLTGLARIVRAAVNPALENVALWHERDISHSSVERVFGPDATIALDFALHRLASVVDKLVVYPEKMQQNLDALGGLVHSQQVLLALTQKGVSREDAYRLVQKNAMEIWHEGGSYLNRLKADDEIKAALNDDELDALFNLISILPASMRSGRVFAEDRYLHQQGQPLHIIYMVDYPAETHKMMSSMSARTQLYEGKGKTPFAGPSDDLLIQYFKDDATAYNALKHDILAGKGILNNLISEHIMQAVAATGMATHFIERLNAREQLIRKVEIILAEVVVRNRAAGSLVKRSGGAHIPLAEGDALTKPLVEYYLKEDALNDPIIGAEHILLFGLASGMK